MKPILAFALCLLVTAAWSADDCRVFEEYTLKDGRVIQIDQARKITAGDEVSYLAAFPDGTKIFFAKSDVTDSRVVAEPIRTQDTRSRMPDGTVVLPQVDLSDIPQLRIGARASVAAHVPAAPALPAAPAAPAAADVKPPVDPANNPPGDIFPCHNGGAQQGGGSGGNRGVPQSGGGSFGGTSVQANAFIGGKGSSLQSGSAGQSPMLIGNSVDFTGSNGSSYGTTGASLDRSSAGNAKLNNSGNSSGQSYVKPQPGTAASSHGISTSSSLGRSR